MSGKFLGILAALLTNVIFGFSFVFEKIALEASHPLVVIAVRFLIAFFAMLLFVAFRIVKIDFRGKDLRNVLLMSITQPVCYFICEMYALTQISTSLSGIVISLKPIMTIFLAAVFLREKTSAFQKICAFVSLAGVVGINCVSDSSGQSNILGVVLMLLAALSASVYGILTRGESEQFSAFERTFLMMAAGAVAFNIAAFAALRGQYLQAMASAVRNKDFMISMAYLAILSSVVAFFAFNFASSHISSVMASAFSNIVTVISVFAGMLVLKEKISSAQLLLCIPVVAGVVGVNWTSGNAEVSR